MTATGHAFDVLPASLGQSILGHKHSLHSGALSLALANSFGTHPAHPPPASGIPRSHPPSLPPHPISLFPRPLPFLSTPSSPAHSACFPTPSPRAHVRAPAANASSVGGAAGWLRAGALNGGRRGGAAGGLRAGARCSAGHGLARAAFPWLGLGGWAWTAVEALSSTMFLHSVNLWNLAFYVFMVLLATLGLWDVFFGFEENKCSMSYMFEYPEYQVRPSLTCSSPAPLGLSPKDPGSEPSGHLQPVSCLVPGRASCARLRGPSSPLPALSDPGPRLLTLWTGEPSPVPVPKPNPPTLLCLHGEEFSSRPVMDMPDFAFLGRNPASAELPGLI